MKLYFTIDELNPHKYQLTEEQVNNLTVLIERVSKVREQYGSSFVVTSGIRSEEDQMRINPKAPKSKHLLGQAVDIYDPDGKINKFCKENIKLLEEVGLWLEERQGPWQHFQIVPPKSGRRFFMP